MVPAFGHTYTLWCHTCCHSCFCGVFFNSEINSLHVVSLFSTLYILITKFLRYEEGPRYIHVSKNGSVNLGVWTGPLDYRSGGLDSTALRSQHHKYRDSYIELCWPFLLLNITNGTASQTLHACARKRGGEEGI